MKKRSLFAELTEGVDALADERQGKQVLRTTHVAQGPVPTLTGDEVAAIRSRLKLSRAVFAGYLHTSARTLASWEQGSVKPNAQAVVLLRLMEKYSDTVSRLATV